MMYKFVFIVFFIYSFVAQPVWAAESPANVGDFFHSIESSGQENQGPASPNLEPQGPVQSLPGVEVSPEDMQKAFPTPLRQDAPRMDFIPNAAPLFPVIPLQNSTQKDNSAPQIANPKTVPSPQLSMPKQDGGTKDSTIKIVPIDENDARMDKDEKSKKQDVAQNDLNNPSLEYMVGQMIMAGFTGGELEKNSAILSLVRSGKVGGVFLVPTPDEEQKKSNPSAVQENIYSPNQLRVLTASLQGAVSTGDLPLFIAIEHEGGMVQSLRPDLGFAGLSSAARLGQGSVEQTEIAARSAGLEMAGLGINFALAPAGDVNLNPLSDDIGKKFRSFGPNPQNVAAHVLAFGRGLVAARVVPCLRNFPGTGSRMGGFAAQPSIDGQQNVLYSIPDIGASWQSRELVPYAKAVEGGWRGAMQPAHVYHRAFDALHPASLSRTLVNGILRGRLGFDGLVLSQDLRALQPIYNLDDAVVQAVLAGADIILVTEPAHIMAKSGLPAGLDALPLESMLSGNALTKELLKQGLSKAMPDAGFGANLEQKIQTGHADEAAKAYDILLTAVRSGRIPMENIRNSWRRIVKVKKDFLQNDIQKK